ncbi:unnamed protein product, partial [Allacma fusca]
TPTDDFMEMVKLDWEDIGYPKFTRTRVCSNKTNIIEIEKRSIARRIEAVITTEDCKFGCKICVGNEIAHVFPHFEHATCSICLPLFWIAVTCAVLVLKCFIRIHIDVKIKRKQTIPRSHHQVLSPLKKRFVSTFPMQHSMT